MNNKHRKIIDHYAFKISKDEFLSELVNLIIIKNILQK